ncbi:MAG TPA: excinuclease ABC subunit C [Acetobacteraceae bacterium]|nr:excinuclease ABC subunit C [Acetobacteraceae bacterium]
MPAGWLYIMTNRPNGTLYTGVTSNLAARVTAHKDCTGSMFTARYNLQRLVYAEQHGDMLSAIQRETNVKRWPRAWPVRLIVAGNPDWDDL